MNEWLPSPKPKVPMPLMEIKVGEHLVMVVAGVAYVRVRMTNGVTKTFIPRFKLPEFRPARPNKPNHGRKKCCKKHFDYSIICAILNKWIFFK
jgi:hypothetical protein